LSVARYFRGGVVIVVELLKITTALIAVLLPFLPAVFILFDAVSQA